MRWSFGGSMLILWALPAVAQPIVDGTRDADYGAPAAVQMVQTQFGDAMPPGNLGGGELDAAYAKVSGGRLYVLLTGNHEPNFNKMDIFIDSKSGGENVLTGTPDYDFDSGGGNWISGNLGGLTFDSGFETDYHLFSRWGSGTDPYEIDFVDRQGGTNPQVPGNGAASPNAMNLIAMGTVLPSSIGNNNSGSALTQDLRFAINNNNAAGVMGGSDAADQIAAAAVSTGIEFSVALADLGNPGPGAEIKISAMYNNGDHNFLSNQVLGGLPGGTGNLGGDGGGNFTGTLAGVDFNQFPGNQFFSVVVPEPSAALLTWLGLVGCAGARRRR